MQRMVWRLAAATATTALAFVLGAICASAWAHPSNANATVGGRMALTSQQSASPVGCTTGTSGGIGGRIGVAVPGPDAGVTAPVSSPASRISAHGSTHANATGDGVAVTADGGAAGTLPSAGGTTGITTTPSGVLTAGIPAVSLPTTIPTTAVPTVGAPTVGIPTGVSGALSVHGHGAVSGGTASHRSRHCPRTGWSRTGCPRTDSPRR